HQKNIRRKFPGLPRGDFSATKLTATRTGARSRFHGRNKKFVRESDSPAGGFPPQIGAASYKQQLAAAAANVNLSFHLPQRGPGFFFIAYGDNVIGQY